METKDIQEGQGVVSSDADHSGTETDVSIEGTEADQTIDGADANANSRIISLNAEQGVGGANADANHRVSSANAKQEVVSANADATQGLVAADADSCQPTAPKHELPDTPMAKLREAQTLIVHGAMSDGSRTHIIEDTPVVAEVALPAGPQIHIVPATLQDSQEMAQHATTMAPPLPPLLIAMMSANADANQGLAAVTMPSTLPCPSPPPPQLCRSP